MNYTINKCSIESCNNKRHNRGGGFLHTLCSKHHRLKYNLKPKAINRIRGNSTKRFKKRYFGVPCQFCGWNSTPCDIHRIIPGSLGGKYTTDNVMVLCPNCHRLEHMKDRLLHVVNNNQSYMAKNVN